MFRTAIRHGTKARNAARPLMVSATSMSLIQPALPIIPSVPKTISTPMWHREGARYFSTSSHDEKNNVKSDAHYKTLVPPYRSIVNIFIPPEKWLSFSPEVRKELLDVIFNGIDNGDNYGDVVNDKYTHLNETYHNGYLDFDKYASMLSGDRAALLNLLWESSWDNSYGGTWALKKKYFAIEKYLSFSKQDQDDLINILRPLDSYRYPLEERIKLLKQKLATIKYDEQKIVKSVVDPEHPFLSLLRVMWKNIRSDLPVFSDTIRRLNLEECWSIVASEADRCHEIITRKIDPELGDIAKSIVGKAKHLASLQRERALSTVQSDRVFNEEFSNLIHLWKKKLKVLVEEKVIKESALHDPVGDDVAIYNVNLISDKYYAYINKIIEKNTEVRRPYRLIPISKSDESIETLLKEHLLLSDDARGESKEEKVEDAITMSGITNIGLFNTSKQSTTQTLSDTMGQFPVKDDEIYNFEVLNYLSARVHSIDDAKLTLKKLSLTDDWSTFYKTNKDAYKIIQNEIDGKLGALAEEAIGKAAFISEIEEGGVLAGLARMRIFTEGFYDLAYDWHDRFIELFKNKKELSDEVIIALYNVHNIIKKYYIQIHGLESSTNEWSLNFPVQPIQHRSYRR